jgi:hypothetical protein
VSERKLVYEDIDAIEAETAEAALRSGDPSEISLALLGMALEGPDFALAERHALEHLDHPEPWVRRNAATSLGHIARVAGTLNLSAAVPALLSLLRDPEATDWADAALDDVEHYMGVNRAEYLCDPEVRAIGYDGYAEIAEVECRDGTLYRYRGVPPDVYRAMWMENGRSPGLLAALDRYPRRKVRVPRLTRRSHIALQAR